MEVRYIVYKTVNLINDKFYIGVHSIKNLKDDYLGSGLYLKRAINKYGKHNFKRETLMTFSSKQEAFAYEKQLVTSEFLKNNKCYNLAIGGYGGNLGEFSNAKKRGDLNGMRKISKDKTPAYGRTGKKHPLYGKKAKDYMPEASRKILAETTRKRQLGGNNSCARLVIDANTGIVYETAKMAAAATGIGYSTVCAIIQGRRSSKRFMYAD